MRDLLIQLNLLPGVGTARLEGLVRAFESLAAFRKASVKDLTALGLPDEEAETLLSEARKRPAEAEMDRAGAAGLTLVTREDAAYPLPLREVTGAPPVLYVRGQPRGEGGARLERTHRRGRHVLLHLDGLGPQV